jgi:DNA-binding GntR family transcriptional regulator
MTAVVIAEDRPGPRTLSSAIYAAIRSEILDCRMVPGQKLHVAALARRFDVSLAAVREALCRLSADGQVTIEDQKGFRVCPVSPADLQDLVETRAEIETIALRRAIADGGDAWEAAVRRSWKRLAPLPYVSKRDPGRHDERWLAAHEEFHAALVSGCRLDRILKIRRGLFEQSERYRRLALRVATRFRDVAAEHRDIMEASLGRDTDNAVRLLASHLRATAASLALDQPAAAHIASGETDQ